MSDISLSPEVAMPCAPSAGEHEITGEQKRYFTVYALLVVGTALTVAMHYVHFEAMWHTVSVALFIAAMKAACVAAIFMHLWHGQRDVYKILFCTAVFAAAMLGLSVFAVFSLPGSGHYLR